MCVMSGDSLNRGGPMEEKDSIDIAGKEGGPVVSVPLNDDPVVSAPQNDKNGNVPDRAGPMLSKT